MSLPDDKQQNIQRQLDFSALTGEARGVAEEETESSGATSGGESPAGTDRLMEEVYERENLKEADSAHDCCGSAAPGSSYRLSRRVTHLEPEFTVPSPSARPRARRRPRPRRLAMDFLPAEILPARRGSQLPVSAQAARL